MCLRVESITLFAYFIPHSLDATLCLEVRDECLGFVVLGLPVLYRRPSQVVIQFHCLVSTYPGLVLYTSISVHKQFQ